MLSVLTSTQLRMANTIPVGADSSAKAVVQVREMLSVLTSTQLRMANTIPVGADSSAKAVVQAREMLPVLTSSRTSPLLQWVSGGSGAGDVVCADVHPITHGKHDPVDFCQSQF